MKTIELTIKITVPDDVAVGEPEITASLPAGSDPVEAFWWEMGVTSRKVFRTAALIETSKGSGYTFDDIAQSMSVDHQTVLAYNRNYSRSAKSWESKTGSPAPIQFTYASYGPVAGDDGPQRSVLLLGDLAEQILALPYPG